MENKTEPKGIVLNRMYTGRYLSTNLGHEVINMFQADNGKHYLYLNARGNYASQHDKQISDMLLVRHAGDDKVEVLAWANGLVAVDGAGDSYNGFDKNGEIFKKQKGYIEKEKVKYGKVDLIDLFQDAEQQNIFITYCAKHFYRPKNKKSIYIQFVNESELLYENHQTETKEESDEELTLYLSGYQFGKATLKQYIYPSDHKNSKYKFDKRKKKKEEFRINFQNQDDVEDQFIESLEEKVNEKRKADWEELSNLLKTASIWEEDKDCRITDEDIEHYHPREISLFDIMPKLQRDENCFSDALKYFMDRDKEKWQGILQEICGNNNLGDIRTIEREKNATIKETTNSDDSQTDTKNGGRIDLFITTENAYIVIENKIKSDINRKEDDGNGVDQLDRYKEYVESLVGEEQKECFYFVLAPDYNMPKNLEEKGYKELHYSELVCPEGAALKSYLEEHKNENLWLAFYDAMKRHSYKCENESLYEDMKDLFYKRIKDERKNASTN